MNYKESFMSLNFDNTAKNYKNCLECNNVLTNLGNKNISFAFKCAKCNIEYWYQNN